MTYRDFEQTGVKHVTVRGRTRAGVRTATEADETVFKYQAIHDADGSVFGVTATDPVPKDDERPVTRTKGAAAAQAFVDANPDGDPGDDPRRGEDGR